MTAAVIAWGAVVAAPQPPVADALPGARLVGQGRLTWWGFTAFDARLWAAEGLTRASFERHPLALELAYLRAFKSEEIVRVSLEEMTRAGGVAPQDLQAWRPQLAALIPDVVPGDRITGVHRPGRGALFYVNDRFVGGIADSRFSENFFAIWLGSQTAQPKLRLALFGQTPP